MRHSKKSIHSFFLLCGGFLFCTSYTLFSQNLNAAKKNYQKALVALDEKNYAICQPLLQQSMQEDSTFIDPVLTLFQLSFELKQYTKSIDYFELARKMDTSQAMPLTIKFASCFASLGNYAKAKKVTESFLNAGYSNAILKDKAKQLLSTCNFALSHPIASEITIENMGDSINTKASEYFPCFTQGDSTLYFMRRMNIQREDFFSSKNTAKGFSKAVLLSDSINGANKKGSMSFSTDLQTLYFAAEYPITGYGRYDIYKSNKVDNRWSAPKNLGSNINTDFWDSAPSITSDGNTLYFSSNRPGGFGGIDLYVCYKNEKGYWEEAVNMGPEINTTADEQTPFIHKDGKTLYFSSSGWPGFGGSDFFVSRLKINGGWTTPLNLGYPINTLENEGSIAVANNGQEAFIASDRSDSRGELDIYKVTLSFASRANKRYFLKGVLNDSVFKKNISGNIQLKDPTDATILAKIKVDSLGQFIVELPYLDSIGIIITSPLYENSNMVLTSASLMVDQPITQYFYLTPLKNTLTQTFINVLFATNSDKLIKGSEKELTELIDFLSKSKTSTVLIEGHTDNKGNSKVNKILSLKRARTIANYLVKKGINSKRITTMGYGDALPITSNATEEGRSKNRRTTFTLTIPK